ncbi:ribbon-helix-helix domain-containing protein [Shuttleworthella satelles]|uniref:Ribbon-helix-helix protein CopG domain-containing protein n=1 Tax=Shuttleworthella satelles DSM 14600 TaxID=626523 RepID=C4GAU6_9FIRM|nr:hypothetical protein [Shuttleworthia satelles]EEP28239.1 hypothetical protein GCWU000342_01047 [Shuttleworthia satelles DSM 14600]
MKGRKVTGIRMPQELDKQVKEIADYLGYTKNGLINQILREWLSEYRRQNEKRKKDGE